MSTFVHLISGGAGSWLASKLAMEQNPSARHIFSFTDVLYEDADAYRFLIEGVAYLLHRKLPFTLPRAEQFPDYRVPDETPIETYAGNPEWRAFLAALRQSAADWLPELVWLVEGRDPWEVFRDERFLGNSRVDPCSKLLKRQLRDRWLKASFDPQDCTIVVGIGYDEKHRFDNGKGGGFGPRMAAAGWRAVAPLVESFSGDVGPFYYLRLAGIKRPRLYGLDYVHNNCGGFCCKAGQGHYANRHRVQPQRFAYDAMMERKLRAYLGADVSMLTDRTGGEGKRALTLTEFGRRLDAHPQLQIDFQQGDSGCGCAIDEPEVVR